MENGDPVCNPCGLYYKLNGVSIAVAREREIERERERERGWSTFSEWSGGVVIENNALGSLRYHLSR